MKVPSMGPVVKKLVNARVFLCNLTILTFFLFIAFLVGGSLFSSNNNECRPLGSEPLPKGIVRRQSNLEMQPIQGSDSELRKKTSKSLLAIAAGLKQKEVVDKIVKKFSASNFTIMLFHYDGVVDGWSNLDWSSSAIHIAATNQTKWWFAKRFLHPDIVAEYSYVFLWDEDLGVDHFDPKRYISIIKKEGLEISQPALDTANSEVHHEITTRGRRGRVHRRIYKSKGGVRCDENSTAPPCTGWVEMMAPVFSRAAWRCVWHMIQNDLIHAWGLDKKLGYCAQGDRSKTVGVVDSEYIVHFGIPTLGSLPANKVMAVLYLLLLISASLINTATTLSTDDSHKTRKLSNDTDNTWRVHTVEEEVEMDFPMDLELHGRILQGGSPIDVRNTQYANRLACGESGCVTPGGPYIPPPCGGRYRKPC